MACPAGGSVHFVQAQVTFTGNGHTESSWANISITRSVLESCNLLVDDLADRFTHLFQIQLTRQDDNIKETR